MINKISEVVGDGHPDKVADYISDVVSKFFNRAGIETMIRANNEVVKVFIMGDVELPIYQTIGDIENNIKHRINHQFLDNICYNYSRDKMTFEYEFFFETQDAELNVRSKDGLSGDQEVVYYTKNPLHEDMKKIKTNLDEQFIWLDWKLLINKVDKIINFSCSKSCHQYKQQTIKKSLLKQLRNFGYYEGYNLNFCWFEGGSIFNDVGVTGRKLIADGDGCGVPHGGGAWSGKDDTKAAVVGRKYLVDNDLEGCVSYVPNQKLSQPTVNKRYTPFKKKNTL